MSTIRFHSSTNDLSRPSTKNTKTRSQLSLSLSLFPSPPPRELGTERENRERPRRHGDGGGDGGLAKTKSQTRTRRHRGSIHLSPPVVTDRESSLYSHRVYASPIYDWTKSCNDLGVVSSLAASSSLALNSYYPLGIIGNDNGTGTGVNYTKQQTQQQQQRQQHTQSVACFGTYNVDTFTPPFHQYHSSIVLPTSTSSQSPYTPKKNYRAFQSTLEVSSESDDYGTVTETELEHSQRSSFTDQSYYLEALNDSEGPLSYIRHPAVSSPPRQLKKWYKPFGKFRELKVVQKVSHHRLDFGCCCSHSRVRVDPVINTPGLKGFPSPFIYPPRPTLPFAFLINIYRNVVQTASNASLDQQDVIHHTNGPTTFGTPHITHCQNRHTPRSHGA